MKAHEKAPGCTTSNLTIGAYVKGLLTTWCPLTSLKWKAKFDVPLVEKLVRMVKSKFIGGQPPHWQPAASKTALEDTTSSIFTVTRSEFEQMTPLAIQHIYRYRHILVTGMEGGRPIRFDEDGLQMLGDLDEWVSIQCKSIQAKVQLSDLMWCNNRF